MTQLSHKTSHLCINSSVAYYHNCDVFPSELQSLLFHSGFFHHYRFSVAIFSRINQHHSVFVPCEKSLGKN